MVEQLYSSVSLRTPDCWLRGTQLGSIDPDTSLQIVRKWVDQNGRCFITLSNDNLKTTASFAIVSAITAAERSYLAVQLDKQWASQSPSLGRYIVQYESADKIRTIASEDYDAAILTVQSAEQPQAELLSRLLDLFGVFPNQSDLSYTGADVDRHGVVRNFDGFCPESSITVSLLFADGNTVYGIFRCDKCDRPCVLNLNWAFTRREESYVILQFQPPDMEYDRRKLILKRTSANTFNQLSESELSKVTHECVRCIESAVSIEIDELRKTYNDLRNREDCLDEIAAQLSDKI